MKAKPSQAKEGNVEDRASLTYDSNYVDPVERTWLPAYSATLLGASTLLLFLRLWLRVARQAGMLGLDDVCHSVRPAYARNDVTDWQ